MGGWRLVRRTIDPPRQPQPRLNLHLALPSPAEALLVLADVVVLVRVLLRPHREPASRLAWIIVVLAVPLLGILGYLILGETRISGRRRQRGRDVDATLPRPAGDLDCLTELR